MKKRSLVIIILFILLSTISIHKNIKITKFNIKNINVENNSILKTKEIKKLLSPLYNKNLIFLDEKEIEKVLIKISFIDSYRIKKKYPNTLQIKIFENKPIAILQKRKNKFYLSEKIDLIEFKSIKKYQNLPYVFGDEKKFKKFYNNLKKIDFPFQKVKKYIYYESNRWDIETKKKIVIKLPTENYIESLKNFLDLENKNAFKNYKLFDYRINNQLILK